MGTYVFSTSSGFLLRGGIYTSMDVLGASYTEAFDINRNGDIVGDYSVDNGITRHGFLLRNSPFHAIDVPGASATVATCINSKGEIGGYYLSGGAIRGFVAKRN